MAEDAAVLASAYTPGAVRGARTDGRALVAALVASGAGGVAAWAVSRPLPNGPGFMLGVAAGVAELGMAAALLRVIPASDAAWLAGGQRAAGAYRHTRVSTLGSQAAGGPGMRPHLAPPARVGTVAAPRPSFSIVIAAYQAAATVAEAVESALGQTQPPVEVVVCDDGSTDGTGAALAPYRSRIVYIRQENRGEGAARNAAAQHANGDFLAFLDADDVYLPDRLDALAELAAARPDLDVLTTDALLESGGAVLRRCYDPSWPFAVDDQRGAILQRNFVLAHAAVRRERFLAAGGFDESMRYAVDWDLWLRLVLDGARVGLVCEPLSRYRLTAGNLSSQRTALLAGRVRVIEKALARGDLSPTERAAARAALAAQRRALARSAAREALVSGSPDARRLALAVALGRAQGPATRLKALAAAISPGAASRLVRAQPVETTAGLAGDREQLPGALER